MSGSGKGKRRSADWFGPNDLHGFLHRGWMKNQGLSPDMFDGRPVIGICNTWSQLTPCNAHLRGFADRVRHGVLEAGGLPLEFPVMSLGESLMRPSAMMFRNLVSMDVEETIRANPIDGVVLLAGCDKTTPALLMGAASCDIPAIVVSGGPMLNGKYRGRDIGSGTDVYAMSDAVRSGEMPLADFLEAESCMSRSAGHCMTMGTASTMACAVEALGIALPHNGAIPAVDSRRAVLAQHAGRRIVSLVEDDVRISQILTRKAFENAIVVNAAIGGSTNFIIHMTAIAGRIGVPLQLDDFIRGRDIPLLLDLMPSGRFLMEDFYYAGGLPAIIRELGELLHGDCLTINGQTLAENTGDAPNWNPEVIRSQGGPVRERAGIAVLRGNLAPDGAVIKPSAADPKLLRHRGRAVVFETTQDLRDRVDDPSLEIDADSIMVLKNAGPKGYPGMPEVGNMPIPKKLLQAGVTDLIRISDARMSGTAYGAVILHVSPEAAAGGTLALVRNGDWIAVDVAEGLLNLEVDEQELDRRRADFVAPARPDGGYSQLYFDHVTQADQGADFDFLVGCRGAATPEESH
jgi:L-arabonate dehydrase